MEKRTLRTLWHTGPTAGGVQVEFDRTTFHDSLSKIVGWTDQQLSPTRSGDSLGDFEERERQPKLWADCPEFHIGVFMAFATPF